MTQTLLSSLRNILETGLSFTCLYFFLFSLSAITPLSLLSFRAECHASLFDIFLCLLRACVFLWRLSIFPNLLGGVHLFAHTHADRCRSFARVTRFRLFFLLSLFRCVVFLSNLVHSQHTHARVLHAQSPQVPFPFNISGRPRLLLWNYLPALFLQSLPGRCGLVLMVFLFRFSSFFSRGTTAFFCSRRSWSCELENKGAAEING